MKIIIVGGGEVGAYVAKLMLEAKNEVRIIEYREGPLSVLKKELPGECVLVGNGAEPAMLEEAGIMNADVVAAVTGADEVNLVVSTIAKYEYGVPRVIGRVNNPKNEWLYNMDMGVDVKVNQANILSHIIADQVDLQNMITLFRLNRGNNAVINATVNAGSKADGKTLKELSLPSHTVIIAIERGEDSYVARGDSELKGGDHILAYTSVGDEEALQKLIR